MVFSLAILCALAIEAKPIINILDMYEDDDIFDKRLALRFFKSQTYPNICLVLFGKCPVHKVDRIGTQIAALATWETIRIIKPQTIASVGTAGGFKSKKSQIGDVFISDKNIFFHGRHMMINEYKNFELGSFPSISLNIDNDSIKKGIISSSDSIPLSQYDENKIKTIGTDAKDMEAASIAEIAHLTKVPMFALKAITDFVDVPTSTHEQFMENYQLATERLAKSVKYIIDNQYCG